MTNPNLRQLDGTLLLVLQALLRERKTTAVARMLGMSQSAVSHALSRLRELFDDPLFVRQAHGLLPTRHALELAPRIDALLLAADEALGLAHDFDPRVARRAFRLGAPDYLAALLAPALLVSFSKHAPHARFGFRLLLGEDALEAVRRDEIDVAIGRFGRRIEDMRVDRLLEDRYCLVARRGHPELRGKLTRALLGRLDHVMVSVAGDFRSPTDETFHDIGVERRVVATVPRFLVAFAVVARTDAVAVAPQGLAKEHARGFGLRVHALPAKLPALHAVAVRRSPSDAATEWLVERLRACAGSLRAGDQPVPRRRT
jgi:DNA-binding transcriptional LysR family regulator